MAFQESLTLSSLLLHAFHLAGSVFSKLSARLQCFLFFVAEPMLTGGTSENESYKYITNEPLREDIPNLGDRKSVV